MNLFALLAVGLACVSSCAVASKDRRLLLNYLDDHLAPSTTTGRWLLSPVAVPVGFVTGVADAVLIHPVSQLDDAWTNTVDALWDFDGDYDFRTVLLTPLRAVATPVVFGVTWFTRSVFDIDDEGPSVDEAIAAKAQQDRSLEAPRAPDQPEPRHLEGK